MNIRARNISPLLPYVAVLAGLYCFQNALAAMLAYHIIAVAFIISGRASFTSIKRKPIQVWMIFAAVVCALGGVIFYFVWPYLDADKLEIGRKLTHYGVNNHTWPYIAVYFCIINATTEEFFWRGYLGTETPTAVLNDFFFGGYHALVLVAFTDVIWTIPVIIACAFAGWLWRMMRIKSGGMLVPIITHILADISIMLAVHIRLFAS